jgi:zinc transporter 7
LVQQLDAYKIATAPQTSSLTSRIFSLLFPGSPAINALLATLYISGPPNFLLALCPPNIDPSSLSVMVAFAVGGLLGDTLFHLLPEIFLGEAVHDRVRFVLVDHNRNMLLGVAIMVGFVTFVAMDKGLRIATGGDGHGHAHSHTTEKQLPSATASGADTPSESIRSRKGKDRKAVSTADALQEKGPHSSIRLAGYLNLM